MARKRKIANFKRKKDLYVCTYSDDPKTIRIGEYDVPLPDMPKHSEMENYGITRRQQRFKRTIVPRDLQFWDKRDERAFVEAEWHKRKNGQWWLINNKPIYLTGKAYVFFNYWNIEAGGLPDFRMEAVEFFLWWEMIERNPNAYGGLVLKPRRIGETEKVLFLWAEYSTRVRNSKCGMQALKEDDAKANYKRLVAGVSKLPYFFKPKSKGTDDPEKKLEFKYPAQLITMKQLKERQGEEEYVITQNDMDRQPLNSLVDYETTKLKRYDSRRLNRYYLDEFGKMTEMNPVKQWGVIKPTMHMYSGKVIVGKSAFTSTIEDFKDGETMENARTLWRGADPNNLDANGRTANGMLRLFRSALLTGEVDRFGFHKKKEIEEFIMNERKSLLDKGFLDEYAELCRRQPLSIEDVFTLPSSECALLPGLLDRRKRQIMDRVNPDGSPYKPLAIRGDLVWENNMFGGNVAWVPNPNGRWSISQHPVRPNHRERLDYLDVPGNRRLYSNGVDPVDHMSNMGKGSDFAIAIFRRYDDSVDGHLMKDENGEILASEVWKMKTDQFVCTYRHRHDDPHQGYDDALKTAIYYGVPMNVESQKPGVINWVSQLFGGRLREYVRHRIESTMTPGIRKRKKVDEKGTPASTKTINMYVDGLKYHIKRRIDTYHHMDQLDDYRQFKVTNRTVCDLAVASGFAVLNALDNIRDIQEEREEAWSQPLWKKFKQTG